MRSVKDRFEHGFVVDDVAARLAPFTESLVVPRRPSLKRMATVQHLSTRITVKDRFEHGFVVDDVAARLAPFTESLVVPRRPSLKRMATVQHLSTRITGKAIEGTRLLDLVDVLHPTRAVGGTPRCLIPQASGGARRRDREPGFPRW